MGLKWWASKDAFCFSSPLSFNNLRTSGISLDLSPHCLACATTSRVPWSTARITFCLSPASSVPRSALPSTAAHGCPSPRRIRTPKQRSTSPFSTGQSSPSSKRGRCAREIGLAASVWVSSPNQAARLTMKRWMPESFWRPASVARTNPTTTKASEWRLPRLSRRSGSSFLSRPTKLPICSPL